MKTIEINNKQYQKCDIVILPSSDKDSLIYSNSLLNKLSYGELSPSKCNHYYLYIISNDEIKEDQINKQICIFKSDNGLITCLAGKGIGRVKTIGKYYSVLATTDTSLTINHPNQCDGCKAGLPLDGFIHKDSQMFGITCSKNKYVDKLPQIPTTFIKQYIDAYNNGNVINKVLVEVEGFECEDGHYMNYQTTCAYPHCNKYNQPKIKLNQNNEISILTEQKQIGYTEAARNEERIFNASMMNKNKQRFSREEVVELLKQFNNDKPGAFDCSNWIEQNLK
jgi:hypothetical protein